MLFLVSILSFSLIHAAPGGPLQIYLKPGLPPDVVKVQMHNMGLDQPVWKQYFLWLGRTLHGDFGQLFKTGQPVSELLWSHLENTVLLSGVSWLIALLIAIPWGIHNSTKQYGLSDNVSSVIGYAGFALPAFWFGILLQEALAMKLNLFPLSDMHTFGQTDLPDLIYHMVLPVMTLTFINLAGYLKYARSSMLEVLGQDYVRTARAKGVPERTVIFRHALRNALIPIITILGLDLPILVAGAALTESVFNWPGMGRLFVDMANSREYSALMAITLITTVVVIVGNLLADILYALVDPRVKLGGKGAA